MVRKKNRKFQESLWISPDDLQVKPQITFYSKLNDILEKNGFGSKIRKLCQPFYCSKKHGRPPIDPEVYFKMQMIGFFENIPSERGIAARCADSLSIRDFLGYSITEATPEHSSLTVIRKRLPESVYQQIFSMVLKLLKDCGPVKGENLALDTSVIEANASMQDLQNRMTAETYTEYIKKLAGEAGINTDDMAAVANFDRKRKDRKTSNKEWFNPHDPDAKIGKTKDGATDMIYKPEHTTDLDTGAIVDADVLPGDKADTSDLSERVINAQVRLNEISDNPAEEAPMKTVCADKGYHKVQELAAIQNMGIGTVIPCRDINRDMSKLHDEEALAVELAHSEVSQEQGKALLRRRGMYVERSFANVLDCGGARRTTLKGIGKIRKRYLIATACYNLSLLMRTSFGIGTPKQAFANLFWALVLVYSALFSQKLPILRRFGIVCENKNSMLKFWFVFF